MNAPEKKLNPQQSEAVNYAVGPLLIVAGAGTGKTTVVTERINRLISEGLAKPEEILALTFTEKAAREMEERVDIALPYGTFGLWISTFHSFSDRILKFEALHIGLNPSFKLMSGAENFMFVKKNFWKFDLKYYRPSGNPYKFIEGMISHFDRLKDEDISADDYLKFAEQYQKLAEKNSAAEEIVEEGAKYLELATAYKTYEDLKAQEGMMDFSDLIGNSLKLFRTRKSVLKRYLEQFKFILVDEFQDTNYAQYELIKLLAPPTQNPNLTVVGDDSQCLPGDSLVTTNRGMTRIDQIKMGDSVLSACGKGHTTHSKVLKVGKRTEKVKLLTFTLKDGKKLTVTDNHKLFNYLPAVVTNKKRYFVYLMSHRNFGWRLGITNNLTARLRIERHADGIIPVGSFESETEARYFESYYACKYGLPTIPFTPRPKQSIVGPWLERLFKEIDTQAAAEKMAKDLHLELESYGFMLNGVYRGITDRVIIHLQMCYRNYRSKTHKDGFVENPSVCHSVWVETSSIATLKKIKDAGYKLNKAKKGERFRMQTQNLEEAWTVAKHLKEITGGIIDKKFAIGTLNYQHKLARIMPASHVQVGSYLPVTEQNKILYTEVVKREEEEKELTTYDLEIDKTHNFIANGVVVHNSIYKFRGAAISNILHFMEDYPTAKQVVLTQNYRSGQAILDASYQLIKHNDPYTLEYQLKIDKNLKSLGARVGESIEFIKVDRVEEEAGEVVSQIKEMVKTSKKTDEPKSYKDFAILVRANAHSEPFIRALERARIPYQFLGPGQLFRQSEIKDLIAYLKVLADFTDSQSLFRVLTMDIWEISPRDLIAILNHGRRSNNSLFETLEVADTVMGIGDDTKNRINKFVEMIHRHQKLTPKETAGQILYYFLEDSGLLKKIVEFKTQLEEHQAMNMTKFFDRIKSYEATHEDSSVFAVVDYLDLAMSMGESPLAAEIDWSANDAVNILTIHSAKGLEFPIVFLVNLIEGRFPSRERREQIPVPDELIRDKETLPEGDFHLQEERRLFYVGVTRAQNKLMYSSANFYGEGKRERKLSPFIGESLGEEWESAILANKKEKQLPLFEWSKPKDETTDHRLPATAPQFKIDFLSYSAIDTFKLCPLHYKLKNILKVPTPVSAAQAMGNSIHLALRDFCHQLDDFGGKGNRGKEKDLLFELLENSWIGQGYESKKHEQDAKEKAQKFLENYLKDRLHQDCKAILLEKSFNFWIPAPNSELGNQLKILGKIDRIDDRGGGKVEIIDYKTGANVPTQRDIDADLQMTIYALAATDKGILDKSIDQVSLSFYYFDNATKMTTTRSKEQLEFAKQDLLRIRDEIQASDFACSHNMFCENCEYKMLCNS